MDNKVQISLAHPLNDEDARRLGLPEGQDYRPGASVIVTADAAQTLISAGYAQVDPEDHKAVKAALVKRRAVKDLPYGLAPQEPDTDEEPAPGPARENSAEPELAVAVEPALGDGPQVMSASSAAPSTAGTRRGR